MMLRAATWSRNPKQHTSLVKAFFSTASTLYPNPPIDPPSLKGIPSRINQIKSLKTEERPFDVLIIGGGATGAGSALDAATRGLRVACIERGDFASETSSRSTKLIWAGIRYLATSAASLLSMKTLSSPISSIKDFYGEFMMVVSCHSERRYMLEKNAHLCNWVPIAIPFDRFVVTPAPFGHPLFALFPILAPFVLKFYDSLSGFSCPPSYVMGPKLASQTFPQLGHRKMKFASVFYEAQHNDARTNLAIALSAAEAGANISNYVEAQTLIFGEDGKAVGATVLDKMTGDVFDIRAKKVIFAGGPFTDSLRAMETKEGDKDKVVPAVQGASGTHIILPGYYSPNEMGLLDYNTSDGRFLFFLPWQGHTLVGTTDRKCDAKTLPTAPEDEIQWLLNECSKYLSTDLRVRRSDVTSAWRGWRPLAVDPHQPSGAAASRDHVISENPSTGVIFIAGGKWTTWREMAEHVIDKVVGKSHPKPCITKELSLLGGVGWKENLSIKLIQKHGISEDVAKHLSRAYGTRAWDVCQLAKPTGLPNPRFGVRLAQGYPYIEAEVIYACREYACTVEDVLSRRTRLAFLNSAAAKHVIPRVADIMQEELGWSEEVKLNMISEASDYIAAYGGPIADKSEAGMRAVTFRDLRDVFKALDEDGSNFLDRTEISRASRVLGFPLTENELDEAFNSMDKGDGRVYFEAFERWWNGKGDDALHATMRDEVKLGGTSVQGLKDIGSGGLGG